MFDRTSFPAPSNGEDIVEYLRDSLESAWTPDNERIFNALIRAYVQVTCACDLRPDQNLLAAVEASRQRLQLVCSAR